MSGRPELDEFVARARNLPHQAELDAATVELLDAFTVAGLEPLLLKGVALARMLYRPGEHRAYSDIDLLVAPRDLAPARRALVELGYANASEPLGIDDVAGIVHAEVWLRAAPSTKGLALMVDLHWRLPGCEAPPEVMWAVLGACRAQIQIEGRNVPVLAREGLALHLATHAAQHGPGNVTALADLDRGLDRWEVEVWLSAARLAERVGATPAFAAGLRLVPAGAELARDLNLPETDELSWAILNQDTRPRGTFHLQAFARAKGIRGRVNVLRRSLLPTREWMVWQYPWAAGGPARLIAARGAHIFRVPVWTFRAWRYRRRQRVGHAR